jgi:catechol 2,3-dioxygenase-like lactoylglutathione lyase family enzyme
VRAFRLNHVSVQALDLEESVRFYTEVLGLERLPSPDFAEPVEWLALGDTQIHLFVTQEAAPRLHHFGLDVDDFEAAFRMAKDAGIRDETGFSPDVRELPDGSVQMYLRDPAGNLVEIDWPDVTTLDPDVVTPIRKITDEREQSESALRSKLYHAGPPRLPEPA